MSDQPFLERSGEAFLPTDMARGFWSPTANLHARVMIGLAAHEIERRHGEPDFQPTRLTSDLYRLPDLSPLTIETRVLREGRRIKLIEAEIFSGGVSSARCVCQLLRRGEQPPARTWKGAAWDVPPPESIPRPDPLPLFGRWEMRPIPPVAQGELPRRTWLRELRQLIAGEAYTPFSRVATGVDFTSPTSNAGVDGLDFINSDVTFYLHRLPVGEWIGYEVTNHQSSEGIAIGQCTLHDIEGPIGFSSCAAVAQKRALKPS